MLLLNCLFFLSAMLITNGFVTESKSNDLLSAKSEKVTVQVYYESLCPGCKQFHTTALPDVYHRLGPYLDLKTYPYGNARRHDDGNGNIQFQCQHGKAECYGNKLHACAIALLPEKTAIDLITCMMSDRWEDRGSSNKDMKHCARELKINVDEIIECANGSKGDQLLDYYGKETDKVTDRQFVPWVLINGNYFDIEKLDFMTEVCKAFTNAPPGCG